ncbi:MAG: hypothetical protein FJX65_18235 [Alphaproteobacteria bacterium]|nr:hypothetical protein [Alphaproteobacteria bacterium]
MIDQEFGAKTTKSLEWLKPVFPIWNRLIQRYISFCASDDGGPTDVPYFYNERVNVGLLASAASIAGLSALEEFITRRAHRGRSGRGRSGRGRADLFLCNRRKGVTLEVKQVWLRKRTRHKRLMKIVEKELKWAPTSPGSATYGSCLIGVASLDEKPDGKDVRQFIKKFKTLSPDVVAWSFPKSCRAFSSKEDSRYRLWYPGVVLAIHLSRKRKGRPKRA